MTRQPIALKPIERSASMREQLSENDPRRSNSAREQVLSILGGLIPPPNFKVVLEVDQMTENLHLRVLKRKPQEYRIWGLIFWRTVPHWDNPDNEQRRIVARTYDAILQQLIDRPEFLEFEVAIEGSLAYTTAWGH